MAQLLLRRREAAAISHTRFSQVQLNQNNTLKTVETLFEKPSFLASMVIGGAAFRFSKWVFIEAAQITRLAPFIPKTALNTSSSFFALSTEVSAFRGANHLFEKGMDGKFSKEVFAGKSWLGSAVDLGTLKFIGVITASVNPILRNVSQSTAMVAAHDLSAMAGLTHHEAGNYVERFANAQFTNFAMGAGLALFTQLNSGKMQALESAAKLKTEAVLIRPKISAENFSHSKLLAKMRSEEELDDLGFVKPKTTQPTGTTAKETSIRANYSPYYLKFFHADRILFKLLEWSQTHGTIGISTEYGVGRIDSTGTKLYHLADAAPRVITDYNLEFYPKRHPRYDEVASARYERRKDRFPIYAALHWHFFLQGKDDGIARRFRDIATGLVTTNPLYKPYTINRRGKELTPALPQFTREVLTEFRYARPGNLELQHELAKLYLEAIYQTYGIDPMSFTLRMQSGMTPGHYMSTIDFTHTRPARHFIQGREAQVLHVDQLANIPKFWTPDIFEQLIRRRTWRSDFHAFNPSRIRHGGALFTPYYFGSRTHALNDLYNALRNPETPAAERARLFQEAISITEPHVMAFARALQDPLLVPIISSAFPTQELGLGLGQKLGVPVLSNAWAERPQEYKHGLEGRTLAEKMEMLAYAFKLKKEAASEVTNRNVILIDDNITDGSTYMMAHFLLMQAGARSVRLVTLTRTVREDTDFHEFLLERTQSTAP